jgi:hypothetical protein
MTTPGGRIVVLDPHAEQTRRPDPRPVSARRASLAGARIAFVDNGFIATRIVHAVIRASLASEGIVPVIEPKRYWRPLDADRIATLAAEVDAVVGGIGQTPPSSTWGIHDAVALERLGVPTVSLATSVYADLLAGSARDEGMPDVRRVILPHPLEGRPEIAIRAVADAAVGAVVAALTSDAAPPVVSLDDA